MKKAFPKRLQLTKDTLRLLTASDTIVAVGGLRSRSVGQQDTCSYRCSLGSGCDGGCA